MAHKKVSHGSRALADRFLRDWRRGINFKQLVAYLVFSDAQNFRQFASNKAHGLLLKASLAERKLLAAAYQQQLAQHFGYRGKAGAFESLGIFAKAAVQFWPV